MINRLLSPATWILVVLVGGTAFVLYRGILADPRRSVVDVVVPSLSAAALTGQMAFDANCAACHGRHGAGTDKGPPLIHDFYNPGHHSDAAFHRATREGTKQHHWRFGDMPPQPQVTPQEVDQIVRYIRELQTANGINYRSHRM